jgi:hypothetical protein
MGIEGAMGHSGELHDLADGDLVETVAAEQLSGGFQDSVLGSQLMLYRVWHETLPGKAIDNIILIISWLGLVFPSMVNLEELCIRPS